MWFIKRINDEIKKSNDANAPASRAAHDNTPDQRAVSGRSRANVPAKLRRFT